MGMLSSSRNHLTLPQLLPSSPIDIGSTGATITGKEIVIIGMAVMVMAGLLALVNRTKLGRAMRATAENQKVAGLMGVNPNFVISATFMIGAEITKLGF